MDWFQKLKLRVSGDSWPVGALSQGSGFASGQRGPEQVMVMMVVMMVVTLMIKVDTSSRYHGAGYFLYPCTSGYTQVGAWLGLLMKMKNV